MVVVTGVLVRCSLLNFLFFVFFGTICLIRTTMTGTDLSAFNRNVSILKLLLLNVLFKNEFTSIFDCVFAAPWTASFSRFAVNFAEFNFRVALALVSFLAYLFWNQVLQAFCFLSLNFIQSFLVAIVFPPEDFIFESIDWFFVLERNFAFLMNVLLLSHHLNPNIFLHLIININMRRTEHCQWLWIGSCNSICR